MSTKTRLVVFFILFIVIASLAGFRERFGGGREYKDVSTPPFIKNTNLELYFSSDFVPGNIAVTRKKGAPTRVFATVHPESKPENTKLIHIHDKVASPYPSESFQAELNTPLGCYVDLLERLWVLDHGNHGTDEVRLFGFDLNSDSLIVRHVFDSNVAPLLSFYNDLSVSTDGKTIAIADCSFWGKKPALVIFDVASRRTRVLFKKHITLNHEGYVPHPPAKKMRFFGGLADFLVGVDGIDFSPDGRFLYWAPMSGSGLFRIPAGSIADSSLTEEELEILIERVAVKPLSDGIKVDDAGNVLIADIENQGIYIVRPQGTNETLIRDPKIEWADGLAIGSDGYVYFTDSKIPDLILNSKETIKSSAPFNIFRFKQSLIAR
jgi:sugar lactone lactonase YvrE